MNQAETVLVVGADGMIGRALAERLAVRGRHVVCTTLVPTPGAVVLDLARDAAEWRRRRQRPPISAPRSPRRTNAGRSRRKAVP